MEHDFNHTCPQDSEDWHESFKKKFGYAGSSGSFTGIRDDEIMRFIRETRIAAYEKGVRNALKVIPEEKSIELYQGTLPWPINNERNTVLKETREAISTLLT